MAEVWKPHTTVAAVCERDGKFLLVREKVRGKIVYNQPAGHLNRGESLIEAVIRETLEETQYEFTPTALQGIYRYVPEESPTSTYIRFLFCGNAGKQLNGPLDKGIISTHWMSYDEVTDCQSEHRSTLVLECIDDYLNFSPCSLEVLSQRYA